MPKTITLRQLKAAGACANQVAEFKRRFGTSVEISVALCESVAGVFNFDWAARHHLSPAALAKYDRAIAPVLAEYERVRAAGWAEYERVTAPAVAKYERVRAAAFARAYLMESR